MPAAAVLRGSSRTLHSVCEPAAFLLRRRAAVSRDWWSSSSAVASQSAHVRPLSQAKREPWLPRKREAVACGDEMLVGAAREVCAGAVGHQRSRIVVAVQQPWIRGGPRFEAR